MYFFCGLYVYKSKKKNKNRKQNFRVQTERENKLNKQEKSDENPKNYTTQQKQSQTLSPTEIVKYENMKTETEIYMNIYLDNYYIYIICQ